MNNVMTFDGQIGDLGSNPENITTYNRVFKGTGSEQEFIAWCKNQCAGVEIVKVLPLGHIDGGMTLTISVKSLRGIVEGAHPLEALKPQIQLSGAPPMEIKPTVIPMDVPTVVTDVELKPKKKGNPNFVKGQRNPYYIRKK